MTIALRTQQIIGHESAVADFVDPLGGSYALEALTDHIDAQARAMIERIDQMGGMLRAIESGFVKKQISDTSYRFQRQVEDDEAIVVGVNRFATEHEAPREILRVDRAVEEDQRERLARFKASRDASALKAALDTLVAAARSDTNLMPPMVVAVRAGATVGEISAALTDVFGRFKEIIEI